MMALERVQKEANKGNLGTVEKKHHKMLRGYWLGETYLASNADVAIVVLSGMRTTIIAKGE